MEPGKERRIVPVSAVNRQLTNWTAIVQVVERHRVQVGVGKNNKPGKRFRRYVLADEHGTKVSAIVFETDIYFFEHKLMPYKRYKISRAGLIDVVSYFKQGDYPFTWVLDYKKLVEPVQDLTTPRLSFAYTICEFTDLFKHVDADSYFNIKGAVIYAFPTKQVKPDSLQRDIVIIDERKIPLIMTLWDEFANVEGLEIASLFPASTTIIALNVKATTFYGLSLSTRKYSYILINPPTGDSYAAWCHNNRVEIAQMLHNRSYRDPAILYPRPANTDIITVTEALSILPVKKTAWVVGKPKFTYTKQQLWIGVCPNCNSKVDVPIEWVFDCSVCGDSTGLELRSTVPIELTEGQNSLLVTLKSPDIEMLTHVMPKQIQDSDKFGLDAQDRLKEAFESLTIICFLRSKKKRADEEESSSPVRYTAVKAYNANAMPICAAPNSPNITDAPIQTASAETEFFTPTTGKILKEIADHQSRPGPSSRSPAAKRNIALVLEKEALPTPASPVCQEISTYATGSETDTPTGGSSSPLKKNKDRLKIE